jgi:glycosyltransferase involved in cell wall biosynthesis
VDVSVVVATNRRSPYLAEAVRSAAEQTRPPREIVVVDDGSADPAGIEADVSGIPGVTVLHRAAGGVSAARNAGAREASGDVLAFLDDDDRWHPRRLERQLGDWASAPDAVAAYCGEQTIDAEGRVLVAGGQRPAADRTVIARREAGVFMPNLLVRRDVFERLGGLDEGIRLAEDLDLVLRLADAGPFVFTPDTLVDYRAHPGNTTRRYRELGRAIDAVVRRHLSAAAARGDRELVAAHRDSLRANKRYAWWAAVRAARENRSRGAAGAAVGDLAWAARFAPLAVPDALVRRLRGVR